MTKDISASIRAKLKNIAKQEETDFNTALTRYGMERLLYRIGQSKYANQYLLKGALLFNLWYDMPHRPTMDIDLLGFGNNELDFLVNIFKDICSITADDGIIFDAESVSAETIKKEAGYTGARIQLFAKLSKAKIRIQVDIGFGDVVTPSPVNSNYPVLISDLPAPKVLTYPIYTVIAEKLHAIALLGMANSRLKDYLDLYVLLKAEKLNKKILLNAITSTFKQRGISLPKTIPTGLISEYSQDSSRQAMWLSFIKKNELEFVSLPEVVVSLKNYLIPIILKND